MCGKVLHFIILCCFLSDASGTYAQQRQNRGEVSYSKAKATITFNNPHDTLGVKYADNVYFTRWVEVSSTQKAMETDIYVFDIEKGGMQLLKASQPSDQEHKGGVTNILLDKSEGRLFFSTEEQGDNGLDGDVSWFYDFKTQRENIFKEGKLAGIDSKGNISILTKGSDSKGSYTQTVKYNKQGTGIAFSSRIYDKK